MYSWASPVSQITLTFVAVEDGYLERGQHPGEGNSDPNVAYENVWSASSADYVYNAYSDEGAAQICTNQGGWLAFSFLRFALSFDTSSIGNQSITGAILSLCTRTSMSDVGPYSVMVQSGQGGYYFPHNPPILTDYNKGLYSGNYGEVNSSKFVNDQYTNITITDLSLIHNATTRMLLRLNVDVDGNHTGWASGQSIGYHVYSSRSVSPPILYLFTGTEITLSSSTSTSTHTVSTTATSTSTSVITDLTTTSVSVTTLTTTTVTHNTTLLTTIKNTTTTTTTSLTITSNSSTTSSISTSTSISSSISTSIPEASGGIPITLILSIILVVIIVLILYSSRKDILKFIQKHREKDVH